MKLTYANITSSIALFVALSTGGAYAASLAVNSVGTAQIRNGQVAVADLSPAVRARLGVAPVPSTPIDGGTPAPSTWTSLIEESGTLVDCDYNEKTCGGPAWLVGQKQWNWTGRAKVRVSGELEIAPSMFKLYDDGYSFPLFVTLREFNKPIDENSDNGSGQDGGAIPFGSFQCKTTLMKSGTKAQITCPTAVMEGVGVSAPGRYVAVQIKGPSFAAADVPEDDPRRFVVNGNVKVEVSR